MFTLKALEIENFRSFKEKTRIDIDDLTTIIGKNDAGKSTVLEALEIFFNNELVKIDRTDANVFSDSSLVSIGCIFSNVDYSLTLDEGAITKLDEEYLLNEDEELEIIKIYDTNRGTIKQDIYVKAIYPDEIENPLINLTQAQLKRIIDDNNIEDENIRRNSNVSMRRGIYKYFLADNPSNFEEKLIHLSKQDGLKLWNNLSKKLPIFALFKADRPSNDEDSEVQDPMKLAVRQALIEVEDELNEIKEKVKIEAMKTASKTLEKLHEMDKDLASELIPDFSSEPKWNNLFKLSLESEHGISINKRGSGVRRLILLNFFRAEVEKQRAIDERGVIYAIEEPETAQHPDNQKMLIESLKDLAIDNCQIMITTHVPGVAELLPIESIRYITNTTKTSGRITRVEDIQLDEIAENLGVIPSSKVKLILYVEGKNDVFFFKHISKLLHENNETSINLFTDKRIAIIPTGGVSSLKDFINKRYLSELDIQDVYIVDKDDGNKIDKAIVTKRREMENYIHPNAIKAFFATRYPELEGEHFDFNFEDPDLKLPEELKNHLSKHAEKLGNGSPPNEGTIKNWLNGRILPLMKLEDFQTIDSVDGVSAFDEVKGWFEKMEEKLNNNS